MSDSDYSSNFRAKIIAKYGPKQIQFTPSSIKQESNIPLERLHIIGRKRKYTEFLKCNLKYEKESSDNALSSSEYKIQIKNDSNSLNNADFPIDIPPRKTPLHEEIVKSELEECKVDDLCIKENWIKEEMNSKLHNAYEDMLKRGELIKTEETPSDNLIIANEEQEEIRRKFMKKLPLIQKEYTQIDSYIEAPSWEIFKDKIAQSKIYGPYITATSNPTKSIFRVPTLTLKAPNTNIIIGGEHSYLLFPFRIVDSEFVGHVRKIHHFTGQLTAESPNPCIYALTTAYMNYSEIFEAEQNNQCYPIPNLRKTFGNDNKIFKKEDLIELTGRHIIYTQKLGLNYIISYRSGLQECGIAKSLNSRKSESKSNPKSGGYYICDFSLNLKSGKLYYQKGARKRNGLTEVNGEILGFGKK